MSCAAHCPCHVCEAVRRFRAQHPDRQQTAPTQSHALSTSDRAIDNQNRAALAGQAAGFPYK